MTSWTWQSLSLDDAGWISELMTRWRPHDPVDPVVLRHRWANFRLDHVQGRWALRDAAGNVVGFGAANHAPWEREPGRIGDWDLNLAPEVRPQADGIIAALEEWLRRDGARAAAADAEGDEHWLLAALAARRYEQVSAERFWKLDLLKRRDTLLELARESEAKVTSGGLALLTFDRFLTRPQAWDKVIALYQETEADIPQNPGDHMLTPPEIVAELQAPDVRPDRVWLVVAGDDLAGLSFLSFPPIRGQVWTGYTATARRYRGRGAAWAAKMATLAQAIELGVSEVRTGNDERNGPILRINERLGYELLPGWLRFRRPL